jgi:hypothetical protein
MFNNPGQYRIDTKTYTLDQDAIIYIRGGNTVVEGEIGSGVSIVCDDSRTAPNNVTGSVDNDITLNDPSYDPDADSSKFFRTLEKDSEEGTPASEGNIFITGDVTYKNGTTSAMGLIAENYMYLHELNSSTSDSSDDIPTGSSDYRHLQLRGQLNSIRQSVQFDFFNYLGENRSTYFNTGAGSQNFNGSLDFKGQMVGNQTDVEGDTEGRGYASDMKIGYDESLKYYNAPMFFNENYHEVPAGLLQFTVTAFFDKGSLGSK